VNIESRASGRFADKLPCNSGLFGLAAQGDEQRFAHRLDHEEQMFQCMALSNAFPGYVIAAMR
jgi:hypothetical protein